MRDLIKNNNQYEQIYDQKYGLDYNARDKETDFVPTRKKVELEELTLPSKAKRSRKIKEDSPKPVKDKAPKKVKTNEFKPKKHLTNTSREAIAGYLFISLWIIGVCIFTLWPIAQAFYYSLCDAAFKGNKIVTEFTWFNNFIYAFTKDEQFPTMLRNYLFEIVIQVPFAITLALLIALMLNQKIRLRGLWRLVFFLPVIIISGPVMSQLMNQGATSINILEGSIGDFVNNNLPNFLSRVIILLFDKLIVVLWYTGIPILIFLAGLQKLNKQIYEAASIDGASTWQTFWKITLPSMSPFILVNAVYMIVALSNSTMAQSTTETVKRTIIQYISAQYLTSTGKGYGYACCIGVIYLLAILLHIGLYALILLPKKPRKRRG